MSDQPKPAICITCNIEFAGSFTGECPDCEQKIANAHNAIISAEREKLDKAGREWLELCKDKATLESCIRQLREQLAAEREKYRISLAVNKDDCETDTNVRNLARPILGDFKVDGDSYGVPGLEDITGELLEKYRDLGLMRFGDLQKIVQLQEQLDFITKRERACCPEHVGFEEYIQQLREQLADTEKALKGELKNETTLFRKLTESQYQLAAARSAILAVNEVLDEYGESEKPAVHTLSLIEGILAPESDTAALDAAIEAARLEGFDKGVGRISHFINGVEAEKVIAEAQQPLVDAIKTSINENDMMPLFRALDAAKKVKK